MRPHYLFFYFILGQEGSHSFAPEPCGWLMKNPVRKVGVATTRCSRFQMAKDQNDVEDLLKKASLLRKEADELKAALPDRAPDDGKTEENQIKQNKTYTSLQDSSWVLSYRFSSDAISRDGDDDENVTKNPTFYSGVVKIQLSADGYTNILENNDDGSSSNISFRKFWGWDEEESREDGDDSRFLLFSADVMLPESDPNFEKKPVRFYFQYEINRAKSGEITLTDGTVTVKKDIEPPGGFWGIFNAGGILAQFRYCGECLLKPY